MMKIWTTALVLAATVGTPAAAHAQWSSKPWGRVSFFSNTSHTEADGVGSGFSQFTTAVTYQLPDTDEDGADYGVDFRYSGYSMATRQSQVSIYDGFVGGRFADGAVRIRAGHMWLNDLGALGSVAGGLFEFRQKRVLDTDGRFRAGVFGGLEPNVLDKGYAPNVTKGGAYVAYDGAGARRDVLGFVILRDQSLTERAVLTTTNFIPVRRRLFIYQAAEYDVHPPAGQAQTGLSYLFANVRALATNRIEIQGTYNRGRSIDTRSLSDDVLNGRPITLQALSGLLYESIGGRLTAEVLRRVHVYVGYSSDKNSRDSARTGRTLIGGYASNVAGSGFDLTLSDSLMNGPTARYSSQYFSLGRQIGRRIYVSGDYSTSLSIVQFSRSDGILVELRPHTRRYSATGNVNLGRTISLLFVGEQLRDDQSVTYRALSGITYRFR